MGHTPLERRLIENEAVFRKRNEQVQEHMETLRAIAKEDGQGHMVPDDDMPLYFYCECSDENCKRRVQLKPSRYAQIHKNRHRFVLIRGHETEQIEHVLKQEDGYCIVEKHIRPPEAATILHSTPDTL